MDKLTCTICQQDLLKDNFSPRFGRKKNSQSCCKECGNKLRREKRQTRTPEEKLQARRDNYKRMYNLSHEQATDLAKNRIRECEICNGIFPVEVDHCHNTDKVRGLLCHHCNIMLGGAKDNTSTLEKAILYLRKYLVL